VVDRRLAPPSLTAAMTLPAPTTEALAFSAALSGHLVREIDAGGGWIGFDRFMDLALYAPAMGYYSGGAHKFGAAGDFVTAPELSPVFAQTLAAQVRQILALSSPQIIEVGAGSGQLAAHLLRELESRGVLPESYAILELSGELRARQRQVIAAQVPHLLSRVSWLERLPERFAGLVLANEVLDAMPVQLLHFDGQGWFERGVAAHGDSFIWADRPTSLRPPVDGAFVPGTVTEIHPQARAFVATLAERLQRGAAFFIDYGFPEAEYYLPARHGGTLMCHRAHRADADPLTDIGEKDITAHVDFTGIALAAQDAGLDVIGYTTQAHFLMNCGLLEMLRGADLRSTANAQKLLTEHEMGELFKVIGLATPGHGAARGFAQGDRTHRL